MAQPPMIRRTEKLREVTALLREREEALEALSETI